MTKFDERRDAFEKKFVLDEELRFKAMARRNKALGLWAAARLGKSGDEAEAYAKTVMMADFEEAGDHDVLRKVKADLEAAGQSVPDETIRATMDELMAQAIRDIKSK